MNINFNFWRNFSAIIELLFLLIGIILLQQITLIPLESTTILTTKGVQILLTIISVILQTILIYAIHKSYTKTSWPIHKISKNKILILILIGIISVIILQYGTSWLQHSGILTETKSQDTAFNVLKKNPIGFYILICILGPVSEEFIFRFFFINKFINILGYSLTSKISAILLSSLIFAIMHNPTSIVDLCPFILVGILLSILYVFSGKIFIPITIHIFLNLLALL